MMKRDKSLTQKALKRDKYVCRACGFFHDGKLEVHHIIPIVQDGPDEIENLITLCRYCHRYAPEPERFQAYLERGGAYKQAIVGYELLNRKWLQKYLPKDNIMLDLTLGEYIKGFEKEWKYHCKKEGKRARAYMKSKML